MKLENLTLRELSAHVKSVVPEALLKFMDSDQKSSLQTIYVNYIQSAPYETDDEDEDIQEIEVVGTINDAEKFRVVLSWSIENDVMFANYEPVIG